MRLYIDKENIKSFLKLYKENRANCYPCLKMIKKYFKIYFNISRKDFYSDEVCKIFANYLTMGANGDINHSYLGDSGHKEIRRPINVVDFNNEVFGEDASSVYLLDDPNIEKLEDSGNFLVGKVGREMDVLSRLMIGEDEEMLYELKLSPIEDYFNNKLWSGLDKVPMPCSDIIIVDSFLLQNSKLYSNNIVSLLDKLTEEVRASKVNIVLFCLKDNNPQDPVYYNDVINLIKYEFSKVYVDASVSIVVLDKKDEFKNHDRKIFTNYLYYESGPTLNFYDSNGVLTTYGDQFTVNSLVYTKHYTIATKFLDRMQNLITSIKNRSKSGSIYNDGTPISSHYLTFS